MPSQLEQRRAEAQAANQAALQEANRFSRLSPSEQFNERHAAEVARVAANPQPQAAPGFISGRTRAAGVDITEADTGGSPELAHFIGQTMTPEEFQSFQIIARDAAHRNQQRGLIQAFYGSPDRQAEINKIVQPQEQQGYFDLEQSIRQRARQEAFARARTGNIGGSVQGGQQAQLSTDASTQGANLAAGFAGQRTALQDALEASRVHELLGTQQIDPATGQAVQQNINTLNGQTQNGQNIFQLQQQGQQLASNQNDEYSRSLANILNQANNQYQIYQQGQAQRTRQNALNARAAESGS